MRAALFGRLPTDRLFRYSPTPLLLATTSDASGVVSAQTVMKRERPLPPLHLERGEEGAGHLSNASTHARTHASDARGRCVVVPGVGAVVNAADKIGIERHPPAPNTNTLIRTPGRPCNARELARRSLPAMPHPPPPSVSNHHTPAVKHTSPCCTAHLPMSSLPRHLCLLGGSACFQAMGCSGTFGRGKKRNSVKRDSEADAMEGQKGGKGGGTCESEQREGRDSH